jgi:hypothetical protein
VAIGRCVGARSVIRKAARTKLSSVLVGGRQEAPVLFDIFYEGSKSSSSSYYYYYIATILYCH